MCTVWLPLQDTLRGVFLLSTTTEWLLAFSILFFVLTFIPGFKRLKDIKVRVTLDKGDKSDPVSNGDPEQVKHSSVLEKLP